MARSRASAGELVDQVDLKTPVLDSPVPQSRVVQNAVTPGTLRSWI
jgi:hypothetical protein